ncbi:TPA: hypothetical protein I8220_001497 [Aeromonas hydrophila]|uniref:hypothetical protein n=1 Tax=Aeromonas TaxID=642 RepID=UPI001A1D70EA|nr:hypothetical protein [Aeromonas hydrophila]BDC80833.1 hypothetical protein NUITMVA1_07760 [Aeromonas hydrophila]HAT2488795.1 hypothetical protein [Aeromonas hydrophila]HAT2494662.1 hypothetical protein [Aeromonas hydrophila]HAT2508997.1 hypothetical protein [Aeromonas hydrophila]HAT2529445.1 hypothetical protein [Aeromonas hydrophila]
MLDDGNDSRKDDKNKATSQKSMKWLIGKLIEVGLTIAIEAILKFLWVHMLPGAEHSEIIKLIVI